MDEMIIEKIRSRIERPESFLEYRWGSIPDETFEAIIEDRCPNYWMKGLGKCTCTIDSRWSGGGPGMSYVAKITVKYTKNGWIAWDHYRYGKVDAELWEYLPWYCFDIDKDAFPKRFGWALEDILDDETNYLALIKAPGFVEHVREVAAQVQTEVLAEAAQEQEESELID